jgi:hypothetical protein
MVVENKILISVFIKANSEKNGEMFLKNKKTTAKL